MTPFLFGSPLREEVGSSGRAALEVVRDHGHYFFDQGQSSSRTPVETDGGVAESTRGSAEVFLPPPDCNPSRPRRVWDGIYERVEGWSQ